MDTVTIEYVCPNAPGDPDHYPYQPSDWGDFDTPPGGCVVCGILPRSAHH